MVKPRGLFQRPSDGSDKVDRSKIRTKTKKIHRRETPRNDMLTLPCVFETRGELVNVLAEEGSYYPEIPDYHIGTKKENIPSEMTQLIETERHKTVSKTQKASYESRLGTKKYVEGWRTKIRKYDPFSEDFPDIKMKHLMKNKVNRTMFSDISSFEQTLNHSVDAELESRRQNYGEMALKGKELEAMNDLLAYDSNFEDALKNPNIMMNSAEWKNNDYLQLPSNEQSDVDEIIKNVESLGLGNNHNTSEFGIDNKTTSYESEFDVVTSPTSMPKRYDNELSTFDSDFDNVVARTKSKGKKSNNKVSSYTTQTFYGNDDMPSFDSDLEYETEKAQFLSKRGESNFASYTHMFDRKDDVPYSDIDVDLVKKAQPSSKKSKRLPDFRQLYNHNENKTPHSDFEHAFKQSKPLMEKNLSKNPHRVSQLIENYDSFDSEFENALRKAQQKKQRKKSMPSQTFSETDKNYDSSFPDLEFEYARGNTPQTVKTSKVKRPSSSTNINANNDILSDISDFNYEIEKEQPLLKKTGRKHFSNSSQFIENYDTSFLSSSFEPVDKKNQPEVMPIKHNLPPGPDNPPTDQNYDISSSHSNVEEALKRAQTWFKENAIGLSNNTTENDNDLKNCEPHNHKSQKQSKTKKSKHSSHTTKSNTSDSTVPNVNYKKMPSSNLVGTSKSPNIDNGLSDELENTSTIAPTDQNYDISSSNLDFEEALKRAQTWFKENAIGLSNNATENDNDLKNCDPHNHKSQKQSKTKKAKHSSHTTKSNTSDSTVPNVKYKKMSSSNLVGTSKSPNIDNALSDEFDELENTLTKAKDTLQPKKKKIKKQPKPVPPLEIIERHEWFTGFPLSIKPLQTPVSRVVEDFNTDVDRCYSLEECKDRLQEIQRRSVEEGKLDLPYSFLIGDDGRVYEGRGWDSMVTDTFNWKGIVIAYIGRFTRETPPRLQMAVAYDRLINLGKQEKNIRYYFNHSFVNRDGTRALELEV